MGIDGSRLKWQIWALKEKGPYSDNVYGLVRSDQDSGIHLNHKEVGRRECYNIITIKIDACVSVLLFK